MIAPPIPAGEPGRLEALRSYQVLDTPPEQAFEDLAVLAAQICGTPISLVTLVDERRQWFKARVGLDPQETPREVSFCAHAVADRDMLVVPDALGDERFADNPLVTGEPGIRFYAGAPLVTGDGHALGTLCVIDRVPRELTADQERALHALARQTMAQLELHRTLHKLQASEAALAAQNERLLELDRLKDDFCALVSHELRTPLTSILSFAGLLLDDSGSSLEDEQQEFLSLLDSNARRLLRLVDDLLFLAGVEAGTLELDPTLIDPADLARDALTSARPLAQSKRIELRLAAKQGPELLGDRDRLQQVLDNLLANAVKFTPRDGRIDVRVRYTAGRWQIEVEDTGIGIPPAEHDRLFERFYRASSATGRALPGTGLGLAIAKAIVTAHGGTIGVASDEGKGATFRVELPLAPPQE